MMSAAGCALRDDKRWVAPCPILRGNLIGGALGAKHECARPPFYEEMPMNETKDPAIDNWMKISRNVRSSCQLNCSIFKEPDADVPFFYRYFVVCRIRRIFLGRQATFAATTGIRNRCVKMAVKKARREIKNWDLARRALKSAIPFKSLLAEFQGVCLEMRSFKKWRAFYHSNSIQKVALFVQILSVL